MKVQTLLVGGLLLFLFTQFFTLYQVYDFVHDESHKITPTNVQHNIAERSVPQDVSGQQCKELHEHDCTYRRDCFPIYGTECGGYTSDKKFITCIPKFEAKAAKKMEMVPQIPKWSYGHPDYQYICAKDPLSPSKSYRFESFIPNGWSQIKCFDCCIKPERVQAGSKDKKLSLVTLVYKETDSFNNSLISWKKNGLFDLVDEAIVYINARVEGDPIDTLAKEYGLKIIGSSENIGIGKAVTKLVLQAKNNLVMFLEKDWEVIEPKEVIRKQLDITKDLILSNVNGSRADAVKLRSRRKAGYPNIDKGLCIPPKFDEEELNDYAQYRKIKDDPEEYTWWLPHLFCNLYHYATDTELFRSYPNRIWKCGCNDGFLCFDSAQCGWTNNPIVFKKHWYLDTLYEISQSEHDHTFEGATYYSKEWIEPHWVVAEGDGFFMHHEINEH